MPSKQDDGNRFIHSANSFGPAATTNVTNSEEYPKAKNALTWADMTYVVAALAAIATLCSIF